MKTRSLLYANRSGNLCVKIGVSRSAVDRAVREGADVVAAEDRRPATPPVASPARVTAMIKRRIKRVIKQIRRVVRAVGRRLGRSKPN